MSWNGLDLCEKLHRLDVLESDSVFSILLYCTQFSFTVIHNKPKPTCSR